MKFHVSGTLLRFTNHRKEIEVDAATLESAMDGLVEKYPDLRKLLFDREGNIRGTHRVFINGEAVAKLEMSRALNADDTVELLTAISGG